jgi:FAD:protein FMN transferase
VADSDREAAGDPSQVDGLLLHVTRRAMACEFEVRFPADRYPQGTQWALEALDLVEALEERLSFFRPTSEIGRINLLAAEGPVEVSPALFDLLRLAKTLHEETHGAYDIASAPLWETWGFARRAGRIPSDAELAEARAISGSHLVELDSERRTVGFLKPGVRINLGSIGKGYAVDVCAERLLALGMSDFLIHGGQSSVLARGFMAHSCPPGDCPDFCISKNGTVPFAGTSVHWEVGIRHPQQQGRRLGIVRLDDRALGTSGGQFQSFRHRGRRYGHILDPSSGRPAEGVFSATVLAPTAAWADALSTAFYVMGPEQSLEYCRRHPEIGVILACPSPEGGAIEIYTAGLGDRADQKRWENATP